MACEVCGKSNVWNAEDENFDSDAKPHVCTTCGQSFSLKIQLKRHTLLHANGEPYVCINCSKNTENKEPKSYNLRLAKKSDKYPCDICGESFSSKRMLLRHSTKEHCYENTNDSDDSDEDDDYDQPKKRKRPYRKRNQKMNLNKCKTSSELVDEQPNKSVKQFSCTTCSKSFAFQAYLDRHVKAGKCKNTTASNKLNLQIKIKKGEVTKAFGNKTHVCNVCGKSFARKSSLEGHELTHVKEKFASDSPAIESEDDFTQGSDSNDYVEEPKKLRLSKIKIQKSYACNQCNYVCFSKPTLDRHLANHREKAKEEEEDKTEQGASSESNNAENSSEKVSDEKPPKETHTCEICDKVFHTKGRLKRHLLFHVTRDTDETEPPVKWGWVKRKRSKDYSCEVCGKQFAGLTCLRKHSLKHEKTEGGEEVASVPKKKKVVQVMECQFCQEVFTGKRSAYIKHVHSHTPEVCGICDQRFVDRPSLREHCRVHVGTEEGRMFMECSQKALDAKNGLLPPEPKVEYIYLVLR